MARFRYKGLQDRPKLRGSRGQMGTVKELRLRTREGGKLALKPAQGQNIAAGYVFDVTDERAIRHLKADPRFELISE